MKKIKFPLSKEIVKNLVSGQELNYDGILYTARDQAHCRLVKMIKAGQTLPFDIRNQIIYYCGPNPAPSGKVIGACGPTTSKRMDEFTPFLLKKGLLGMVGKGSRSKEVIDYIRRYKAVYFITYAGCAALLSRYVEKVKLICFKDLGPEAVFSLKVKNFPLLVAVDSKGGNIYG